MQTLNDSHQKLSLNTVLTLKTEISCQNFAHRQTSRKARQRNARQCSNVTEPSNSEESESGSGPFILAVTLVFCCVGSVEYKRKNIQNLDVFYGPGAADGWEMGGRRPLALNWARQSCKLALSITFLLLLVIRHEISIMKTVFNFRY